MDVPVWGTVSTSGLYLIVFSIVRRCRRRWKTGSGSGVPESGSGVPENYVVAAEITLKCIHVAQLLLLPVLVDFYFRFAYAVKRSQHKSHWLDCI